MKALILAGGQGTRLRPYTTLLPKPLLPVGQMPVLELILRQLKAHGITEVVLAVNHLRQLIEAFFRDGAALGLHITYAVEDKPLGTAGPIHAVLDRMSDNFFVMNGDLLTTLDFRALADFHRSRGASATISTYKRTLKSDFGIIEHDAEGRMTGYREKPTYEHEVSMGCYVLNRNAVRPHIPPATRLDMPELMQRLAAQDRSVYCYTAPCFWLDIGRPEDYQAANEIMEREPHKFLPPSA